MSFHSSHNPAIVSGEPLSADLKILRPKCCGPAPLPNGGLADHSSTSFNQGALVFAKSLQALRRRASRPTVAFACHPVAMEISFMSRCRRRPRARHHTGLDFCPGLCAFFAVVPPFLAGAARPLHNSTLVYSSDLPYARVGSQRHSRAHRARVSAIVHRRNCSLGSAINRHRQMSRYT